MSDATTHRIVTWLLVVGVIATLAWVLTALVRPPSHVLMVSGQDRGEVVARVNGSPIDTLSYDRALAGLTLQERGPDLTEARRRDVLQALIDEELLLQEAARLQLHYQDPLIRRRLVNVMLDSFATRVDPARLSEKSLRGYYRKHAVHFSEANRVAVDAFFFEEEDRALQARHQLVEGNGDRNAVEGEKADMAVLPVPDGLLPRRTLENYLGPTAARTAERMMVGDVSDPIRTAGGFWILRLTARELGEARPFEEVREAVASLVRREETDRLLQAWLTDARTFAVIEVSEDAVDPKRRLHDQAIHEVLRARQGEDLPEDEPGVEP